jgi:cobalt/nickel transport system permease protein
MSHIHIPDGVLPLWLIAAGWLATITLVAIASRRATALDLRRRIPLVGAMGALMLVAMSSEIVPIAYHVNLTVVAGALLGPWLSIITAVVVDTVLALLGHGGVTVIGLNTLVISAEMIAGWAVFRALLHALGRKRAGLSAGIATVIALAISTTLLVGIVALGGSAAASRESGALDPSTLRFSNPFSSGVFSNAIVLPEKPVGTKPLSLARFATMVYTLGAIGWVIEALISAAIVGYVARVRPGLLAAPGPVQIEHVRLGDEGVHR